MFLLALLIILYSILLLKYDSWIEDFFYFTTFFGLVIALDYFFYSVHSRALFNKSHLVFCLFPVKRVNILFHEFLGYITRVEIIVFMFATLWLINSFYFLNETRIFGFIYFSFIYSLQVVCLILFLVLIKNIIGSFRDFISAFVSLITILTVFSGENKFLWTIFVINPFCNGFFSFLLNRNACFLGYGVLLFTAIVIVLIARYSLRSWPLSKTPSNFL